MGTVVGRTKRERSLHDFLRPGCRGMVRFVLSTALSRLLAVSPCGVTVSNRRGYRSTACGATVRW